MSTFEDSAAGNPPHFVGHRERLKARFRQSGADALADYEFLELLLFHVVPRRDTKPIAKALLARFGSFSEVLAAPEALLTEVPGVGEAAAGYLKLVLAAVQRFGREFEKLMLILLMEDWQDEFGAPDAAATLAREIGAA